MSDNEMTDAIRQGMRMNAKLNMMAWNALDSEIRINADRLDLNDDEIFYVEQMLEESQKIYDNIDEFVNDVLADPAALTLQQAAMGDLIDKWNNK